MALNLIKLSVGSETVESLREWHIGRLAFLKASGKPAQLFHTTRMVPKRTEELLDGGSIYWVIKGKVQARQRLVDIVPFTDGEGIRRCHLMLDNTLIETNWQPRRAFQGWRYLTPDDAPTDLGAADADVPAHLKAELADLGLL